VDGRWNFIRKESAGPDDVGFVEAVLNDLTGRMCLDDRRVFAVGYSDGADMAFAAACVLTGRFAAVVTVAASTFPGDCAAPPPSVLEFHGSADPVAPYSGGGPARPAPFDGVRAQPVEDRLNQVAAKLGCTDAQNWSMITAKTKRRVWMGCRGGGDVGLIVADGGGHTWLGAEPRPDLGPTVSDMSATEVTFLYFVGHAASPSPSPSPRG
jgi:polyhydroxybutyrate depolymerase